MGIVSPAEGDTIVLPESSALLKVAGELVEPQVSIEKSSIPLFSLQLGEDAVPVRSHRRAIVCRMLILLDLKADANDQLLDPKWLRGEADDHK